VVRIATVAQIATRQIRKLAPDVFKLDILMLGMGGLDFFEKPIESHTWSVVMVSSDSKGSAGATKALELEAIAVIGGKLQSTVREGIEKMSIPIVVAFKAGAQAKLKTTGDIFLKS
jgi:chemotaxis response regulator CheB